MEKRLCISFVPQTAKKRSETHKQACTNGAGLFVLPAITAQYMADSGWLGL